MKRRMYKKGGSKTKKKMYGYGGSTMPKKRYGGVSGKKRAMKKRK